MRSLVIVCFLGAVIAATVRPPPVRGEAFGTDEALFAALRDRMVTEQIRARDVADRRGGGKETIAPASFNATS